MKNDIIALLNCPECALQVSVKALTCPHCGYPLDKSLVKRIRGSGKRRRLPNGFGSITERRDKNLKNSYWARVCIGKKEFGKPILNPLKPQCSFSTYNAAYAALVEYNKNPYDLNGDITVKELYEKWSKKYFSEDVRARHIKGVMDSGFRIETRGKMKGEKVYASAGTKARIKSIFNLMLDYAVEFEIAAINYARTFDISDEIVKEQEETNRDHIPFTKTELNLFWDNVGKIKFTDWILIQTYMGWRPQELATLRLDEIDLDQWYMQAGMKTDAGKPRLVPIHSKIRNLAKKNYEYAVSINSEYLFNDKSQTHSGSCKMSDDKYRHRFDKVIQVLHMNPLHRPHDPRMTFITIAKKSDVDEYAIKAMVGHKVQDIAESTYTVRDIKWLRTDLEKISEENLN
ncbi:tyrosine-type recombinase/integrase [Clostridium sp. AN503]|uniref:tyrosine-type recombinase/integrase n=1 Tax=Clostridium sp. AN503 TaxID=3160598 RepID=UPI0034583339